MFYGYVMFWFSTLINKDLHLESFSWFICDLCDRMVPFLLKFHRSELPSTINRQSYHTQLLRVSMVPRSRKFHNMFFCVRCKWQPSRSRTTCIHSVSERFYIGNDDILRLDVSVSDTDVMQIVDRKGDLSYYCSSFILYQFLLLELLVKCSSLHILKYNIEMSLIIKKTIHFYNICIFDTTLNPDFECELIDHHIRLNQRFRNLFQSE